MKKSRRTTTIIAVLFILGFILLVWTWIASASCPFYPSNRPSDAPDYIRSVWPSPGTAMSFQCYTNKNLASLQNTYLRPLNPNVNGGIYVEIDTNGEIYELETPEEKIENVPEFYQRVSLYIDNRKIVIIRMDEDVYTIAGIASKYLFGSNPILFPGEHIAKLVIVTKVGITLEYEWHFRITW